MKNFALFVILLLGFKGNCQNFIADNFPTKDGMIYYSDVVEVDTALTATDLYLNAKSWLVGAFKSSKSVIQVDDKDLNIVVVKSYLSDGPQDYLGTHVDAKKWFTLKIETKEHRYRYTLTDVRYECDVTTTLSGVSSSAHVDEGFEEWISKLEVPTSEKKRIKFYEQYNTACKEWDAGFKNIIVSLETAMKSKTDKDW
jgi:hypothetical protein